MEIRYDICFKISVGPDHVFSGPGPGPGPGNFSCKVPVPVIFLYGPGPGKNFFFGSGPGPGPGCSYKINFFLPAAPLTNNNSHRECEKCLIVSFS